MVVVAGGPRGGSGGPRKKQLNRRAKDEHDEHSTHDDPLGQGSQAKQAHEALRYVLDDRKTWFRKDFPLVTPGEVDIYDPDKSANVRYKGRATALAEVVASKLLTMGAMQSLVWGLVVYLLLVLLFAALYLVGGEQCVNEEYIDLRLSLFLSCHTMSTVGYGSLYPISDYCNIVMLWQSYVNIALLAVITSAVFVNFSRPHLNIRFSESCCIYNLNDETKTPEICFQIVKLAASSMYGASVQAILWDYSEFPEVKRLYLELEQPNVSWIDYGIRLRHIVDVDSPFVEILAYAKKFGRLPNCMHILVTLSGVHAPTGTPITCMYCYSDKNMKLHRKFVQDFNGRRVPDGENVARSFWYEIFFGKLRPASLEIDLRKVDLHLDEEVVNAIERREKARKRFIKAVILVLKQNSMKFNLLSKAPSGDKAHRPSAALMKNSATEVVHNIYGGNSFQGPSTPAPARSFKKLRCLMTSSPTSPPDDARSRSLNSTHPQRTLTTHVLDGPDDEFGACSPERSTQLNPLSVVAL